MKTVLSLLFVIISHPIFSQISYLNYIDTNYVKPNITRDDPNDTSYKFGTSKEVGWKVDTLSNALINSIFIKKAKGSVLVVRYTDSIHNKYIIREYYQSGKLKSVGENSFQLHFIYTFDEEFEQPYYVYFFHQYKLKNGRFTAFYENGCIEQAGDYIADDRCNCKTGPWILRYENGNPKRIENFTIIRYHSARIGEYKEFYENGTLKIEGQYGIENLCCGHLDAETGDWDIANKEGEWKEYGETGKLKKTTIYKDNVVESEVSY